MLFILSNSLESAKAQANFDERVEKDSTDQKKDKQAAEVYIQTRYLLEDSMLYKPDKFSRLDTSLDRADLARTYDQDHPYALRINNYGSAAQSLVFDPQRAIGYSLGLNAFAINRVKSSELRYYDSYSPYSQLKYTQGSGELQVLDVFHSQSFSPYFNVAVTYHSLKSEGFYLNESNRLTDFSIHSLYSSPNGRYKSMFYALWNTTENQENGGIKRLESFANDSFQSQRARVTQPIRLTDGATNWIRDKEFGWRQMFYFGSRDSIKVKGMGKIERFAPRFYLSHKAVYRSTNSKFSASDTSYFEKNHSFIDEIFEVTKNQEMRQILSLGTFLNDLSIRMADSSAITSPYPEQVIQLGMDFRTGRTGYWGLEGLSFESSEELIRWRSYYNAHLFGRISKSIRPETHLLVAGSYVLFGDQFSDYNVEGVLTQKLAKKLKIVPYIKAQAVSPTGRMSFSHSSYARWDNDFKKEFHNDLGTELRYRKNNKIAIAVKRSDQFIYFDQKGVPVQSGVGISYLQARLFKRFELGKFTLENTLTWQQINKDAAIQFPDLIWQGNYYFESTILKEVATLRIGLRMTYYNAYQAMAYRPEIMQFTQQTTRQTGAYPLMDGYISASINRWNGYVKISHFHEELMGFDYEMLPNYTARPMVLNMGLAWRFYN